jgi:DNA-binding SARP family transcriptional activator
VTVAGRLVALPAKQRTLLAVLALQANRSVPSDSLVEASWGQDASPTVARTLQSHMFQLRRALSPGVDADDDRLRIVTDARSYRLEVAPAAVDAKVFLGLLVEARDRMPDSRRAIAQLDEALGLWRGPRVADVGDEPAAMAEVQQLEELRISAVEDLARMRLALGEHERVIPDLRRAVAEAPFREPLWASLMVALARSGRRAEALIAYRHAETAIRGELDIEPSRELQEVACRIREDAVPQASPAGRKGDAPLPIPVQSAADTPVHAC